MSLTRQRSKSRFARAVRADQRHCLTVGNGQIDARQRDGRVTPVAHTEIDTSIAAGVPVSCQAAARVAALPRQSPRNREKSLTPTA